MTDLYAFLSGAVTILFALAGLFFLRSWRRTGDRLFISFGLAFWLLSFHQAVLSLAGIPVEERSWTYLLRLTAFALIIGSVWRKNLKA